jgi:hypothetical protein
MKDPVTVCKAKTILEKALEQDEMYLPAVYLLAEIYEQVSYTFSRPSHYITEWHCSTSRRVMGSISDEVIGFFN